MSTDYRYQQLEQWLLAGIKQGRWQPGERLPSIRALCQSKGISKATVQHALQRLEAQGVLEARPKAGFFVTYTNSRREQPQTAISISAPRPVSVDQLLLDIMQRSAAFDLCPNPEAEASPAGITALNRSIARALRRQQGRQYQYYDEPAGEISLREQLALHYARRGLRLNADAFCITSGCQHALFLALMACCQKGDVVAVESPGFYGTLQLLQQLELQVVEIPCSGETGMDMDALNDVLQRWPVKACIVSPAFATPTGALMPLEAKQRLIALANRYDLAVIEDDIYGDTAFIDSPDPLKALDSDNRVILCSSFSKNLSRDLRLGWICAGRWQPQVIRLKLVTQLASSRYQQIGVADFMNDGGFGSHLRRLRNELRQNRDKLIQELQQWSLPVKFTLPQGGMALWTELPNAVDTLAQYSSILAQGIVITPGPLFSTSGDYRHCLRLSFAHQWQSQRLSALQQLPVLLEK